MLNAVIDALQHVASEPLGLVFAMVLGVVSAVTSACCTLPALGAVLLGVSLSKISLAARGADAAIRWVAGAVLVIAGFYFLVTF